MSAEFEKGSDLEVRVNGTVLGGVTELRRRVKRSANEIREFLTDKPKAVIPSEVFYIVLKLRRTAFYPFDGGIGFVDIISGSRRERYSMCTVLKAESRAFARGEAEYTVVIEAEERSVWNE